MNLVKVRKNAETKDLEILGVQAVDAGTLIGVLNHSRNANREREKSMRKEMTQTIRDALSDGKCFSEGRKRFCFFPLQINQSCV